MRLRFLPPPAYVMMSSSRPKPVTPSVGCQTSKYIGAEATHDQPPRIICFAGKDRLAMAWYPRDNDVALRERRWAVLSLLVAPTGDFSPQTVAHTQRRFQLACCSRAVQGDRLSSNTHEVVALLGSLGYPPPREVTCPSGGPV